MTEKNASKTFEIAALVIATISCLAAAIVVPEVRQVLRLDRSVEPAHDSIPLSTATLPQTSNLPATISPTIDVQVSPIYDIPTLAPSLSETPVFPSSTQNIENYLEIEINGDHRFYKGDSFAFSLGKWTTKLRNSDNMSDSFEFHFPPNIQSGTTVSIKGDFGYVSDEYEILYTTISGREFYSLALLPGDYFNIKIENWDENNGVAIGKIEGEIHPIDATPLKFSDGKFIISIAHTNY